MEQISLHDTRITKQPSGRGARETQLLGVQYKRLVLKPNTLSLNACRKLSKLSWSTNSFAVSREIYLTFFNRKKLTNDDCQNSVSNSTMGGPK